jgi:hypothetical protein
VDNRIIDTKEDGSRVEWTLAFSVEQLRDLKDQGWEGPDESSLIGRQTAACYRLLSD